MQFTWLTFLPDSQHLQDWLHSKNKILSTFDELRVFEMKTRKLRLESLIFIYAHEYSYTQIVYE